MATKHSGHESIDLVFKLQSTHIVSVHKVYYSADYTNLKRLSSLKDLKFENKQIRLKTILFVESNKNLCSFVVFFSIHLWSFVVFSIHHLLYLQTNKQSNKHLNNIRGGVTLLVLFPLSNIQSSEFGISIAGPWNE